MLPKWEQRKWNTTIMMMNRACRQAGKTEKSLCDHFLMLWRFLNGDKIQEPKIIFC